MTQRSVLDYARAVKPRYLRASKGTKTKILDEFTATTGMHRKAAIRLLNRCNTSETRKKHGRPRIYDIKVETALKTAWDATDHLCSKRLQPFLSELIEVLKRTGELKVTAKTEAQLSQISASTIDRVLRRQKDENSP